jgi:hypothetical protein
LYGLFTALCAEWRRDCYTALPADRGLLTGPSYLLTTLRAERCRDYYLAFIADGIVAGSSRAKRPVESLKVCVNDAILTKQHFQSRIIMRVVSIAAVFGNIHPHEPKEQVSAYIALIVRLI